MGGEAYDDTRKGAWKSGPGFLSEYWGGKLRKVASWKRGEKKMLELMCLPFSRPFLVPWLINDFCLPLSSLSREGMDVGRLLSSSDQDDPFLLSSSA